MVNAIELRTRTATLADAAAIATIYNKGIADRIATFETKPRTTGQIGAWFKPGHVIVMSETRAVGPVAPAASFPYSARPCYAGIGEFSVYVARAYGGCGDGCAVLGLGFAQIGIHRRYARLDGFRRDCVIIERLLETGDGEHKG
ncbi:MAG TPA: hypothetical protein VJX94_09345 [Stellaceae bacterium]|nr:hypothetical protein [Stellaceae bacterium]